MAAYTYEIMSGTTGEILTYMKAHTNYMHIWRKAKSDAGKLAGPCMVTIQYMSQSGSRTTECSFIVGL